MIVYNVNSILLTFINLIFCRQSIFLLHRFDKVILF